ncbi:hypothetical protein DH2020_004941 [Rehmannia glutinosa]|uniref:UDP-glycosyltransferase n=1 Tax=Rehmannia glutinosa TaxID=99300 RepID=A0ABR0XQT0_REHGL
MEEEASNKSSPPHNIALLPPPCFLGHLIPFIELSKKLVSQHNCCIVTLIIPHDHKSTLKTLLQNIPPQSTLLYSPISTADLPENIKAEILVPIRVIRSLPSLRQTLSSLRTPASALVVDLFAPYAIDLDESCGLSKEYRDLSEPIRLPGSIVLNPDDFPDSMKDRNSEVNTWMVDRARGIPPVYPVGPLIRTGPETESDRGSECLKWLNNQPPKSVLFVSFGSGGTLSLDQFTELALGLEMSKQRFLWVVRTPQENIAAAYLNTGKNIGNNPLDYLPQGFLERTKERGLVVASWAPQIQVLSHGSTGGFLGVPLIAWPLCFEQKMNAVVLRDGLKAAIRVEESENGIVERGYVSETVKQLMEGEEGKRIRERIMDLNIAAGNALSQEGSSSKALAHVVQKWISGK